VWWGGSPMRLLVLCRLESTHTLVHNALTSIEHGSTSPGGEFPFPKPPLISGMVLNFSLHCMRFTRQRTVQRLAFSAAPRLAIRSAHTVGCSAVGWPRAVSPPCRRPRRGRRRCSTCPLCGRSKRATRCALPSASFGARLTHAVGVDRTHDGTPGSGAALCP